MDKDLKHLLLRLLYISASLTIRFIGMGESFHIFFYFVHSRCCQIHEYEDTYYKDVVAKVGNLITKLQFEIISSVLSMK